MDPIQRKITPNTGNIQGPQQTSSVGGTQGTGKKFELDGAAPAANTAGADATQNVGRPTFDDMAAFIKDAAGRSLTKDQCRDGLIEHEAKKAFGDDAYPKLTAAVSQAFVNDPHLSQLFNSLYAKATKQAG